MEEEILETVGSDKGDGWNIDRIRYVQLDEGGGWDFDRIRNV